MNVLAKAKEDYCKSESKSFNKLVGGEMEKSQLIGIDDKFDEILKCCELYLNSDDEFIDMREKLSIISTFLFNGLPWLCLRELKRYSSVILMLMKDRYSINNDEGIHLRENGNLMFVILTQR